MQQLITNFSLPGLSCIFRVDRSIPRGRETYMPFAAYRTAGQRDKGAASEPMAADNDPW
jgi:hypothetical protein